MQFVVGTFQLKTVYAKIVKSFAIGAVCGNFRFAVGNHVHATVEFGKFAVEVVARVTSACARLEQHSLGQLFSDLYDGVKTGQRILEYHSYFVAAQFLEIFLGYLQQILSVVDDFSAFDDRVACQNAHYGAACNRLAAARLAHDCQRFALVQVKTDVTYGLHFAVLSAERNNQIFHFEFLFHDYSSAPLRIGLSASRNPLPNKLKLIINNAIMTDGNTIKYGMYCWLSANITPNACTP